MLTMIPLTNNPITFARAAANQGDEYAAALYRALCRADENAEGFGSDAVSFDYWKSRGVAVVKLMESHMYYLRAQVVR